MSSGKTLREKYYDFDEMNAVGVIRVSISGEKSRWRVFTPTQENTYRNWQTAIKVAYGERTP